MIIGSTISHYRIVAKLGEGGMGVVYKAEDTTLERAVALKFLADHLLNDAEAKERFLREAKAAAALHHPNVCPVHEIGEADGKTFIAMAFLEGESLEDRIAKGPLPIKESLDIARQVAEGLQAAHAKGIVHRDIKPANILVSPEGRPTIMDFGLARLTEASRLTKVDTAMGTVAYMSPEQAQGMEVDHRTDVWALGCVLYEMVSGQRPFLGQYDQALLYEIVHEEVAPLTSIRTAVPMELEFIAGKCLAKDRDDRYQAARETAIDLRTLAEKLKSGRSTILRTARTVGRATSPTGGIPPDGPVVHKSRQLVWQAVAAAAIAALAIVGILYFTQTPPDASLRQVARFSVSPDGAGFAQISPDGANIAYVARQGDRTTLWLRPAASESARELPGTDIGSLPIFPSFFFSPDGRTIAFAGSSELKRVSLDGGDPVTLCALPGVTSQTPFAGGSWSPGGESIIFSSGGRLFQIPARGGDPDLLFEPAEDEQRQYAIWPQFLPLEDPRRAIVYSAGSGSAAGGWMLMTMDLQPGERRELVPGTQPIYSKQGFLLYGPPTVTEPGLRAAPFSLQTLSFTGDAFPVAATALTASVSDSDTLIYLDASAANDSGLLVWRNRSGEVLESVSQPQPGMDKPALSPDNRQAAVVSTEGGDTQIWIQDLGRRTKTPLTFGGTNQDPAWPSSGRDVAYASASAGGFRLESKSADGTGEAAVLAESQNLLLNPHWSSDGRYLLYQRAQGRSFDIVYQQIAEDGSSSEPMTLLGTAANEHIPKLSPDGRFLAYASNESGQDEIYVRTFPDGGGRLPASLDGGT